MAGIALHHDIVQRRIERDRAVGRQRPGCGGPDHDGQRAFSAMSLGMVTAREQRLLIQHREADIDGESILVLVFHFGLRQRGAAIRAPVHRFVAFGEVAVPGDPAQRAYDIGLDAVLHGEIGIPPIAHHPQANEITPLAFDLLAGIFAAGLPELRRIHLDAGLAGLLLDIEFDRQAVAVPTGNIGRIEPAQGLALDDDVLQDLVDGMADMDVAIGVGRPVMQHESRASPAGLAQRAVEVHGFPALEYLRFALGQIALHGESRVGKIQGIFVISH